MARDSFLLRTDPQTLAALRKWAGDELRSVNGQIEFVLRRALRESGRLVEAAGHERTGDATGSDAALCPAANAAAGPTVDAATGAVQGPAAPDSDGQAT